MSGNPYITPLDPMKFREAYLATLGLQAKINAENLQANQVYKKMGVPAQPTDTRTSEQKLADILGLRRNVRSKLSEIADGANASKIAEALDPVELRFLANQIDVIIADLKPKYKLGIDATIFQNYLQKYMKKFEETQGVEYGLQQNMGDQLLANQYVILGNMANKADINNIIDGLVDVGFENTRQGQAIKKNLVELETLLDYLPEYFETINNETNAVDKADLLKQINLIVKDLPTKAQLANALLELAKSQSRRDTSGIQATLQKLEELTTTGADTVAEFQILRQLLEKQGGDPTAFGSRPAKRFVFNDVEYRYIQPSDINTKGGGGKPNREELLGYLEGLEREIGRDFLSGEVKGRIRKNKDTIKAFLERKDDLVKEYFGVEPNILVMATANVVGDDEGEFASAPAPVAQKKIAGKGVFRPYKSADVIIESDIDRTRGISHRPPRFVPFGRFVINKDRLDKDIVSIKRPAGGVIPNLKSVRVGTNVGRIMRKIVGGQIPSYEDIDGLNAEEKGYLHKVMKHSNLLDRINIPSPNKDDDEKDVNLFEIMRGQIVAGNDSMDLIKKFKQHIIKMSEKTLLPKGQVKDMLIELAKNGY
jgi:hypothetical protein